jgi:hypothetical protein
MADNQPKTVMYDPQKKFEEGLSANKDAHHKNAEAYLMSNFFPIIDFTIKNMRSSGKIPEHIGDDELIDAASMGLWKAIANHNPDIGTFQTYAVNNIKGAIQSKIKPKDISSADLSRNARYNKLHGEVGQKMSPQSSSVGLGAQSIGGGISDEGGGLVGIRTEKSPHAALAEKIHQGELQHFDRQNKKFEQEEAQRSRLGLDASTVREKAGVQTPIPEAVAPQQKEVEQPQIKQQISSPKKIVIRRAADIAQHNPDVHERLKAVDANRGGSK